MFEVILDSRTGRKFLDNADGFMRSFEKGVGKYRTRKAALAAHPGAKDITGMAPVPG